MSDRVYLSYDDAIAMLPDDDIIHTFRSGGAVLVGCDWQRDKILDVIRSNEPELSGELATSMNHGLCVIDERGPLFIETRSAEEPT